MADAVDKFIESKMPESLQKISEVTSNIPLSGTDAAVKFGQFVANKVPSKNGK
jgi:hypothetical protein